VPVPQFVFAFRLAKNVTHELLTGRFGDCRRKRAIRDEYTDKAAGEIRERRVASKIDVPIKDSGHLDR
jgi:hypothetical protein